MLNGITIPGVGTINNTTLTGSQALRKYSVTNAFIANGSVGALANFFNTTSTGTGVNGGLLSHAGLPQNFIVVNPQFNNVQLIDNNGNSTYDSLQVHITKRLGHGFTGQGSYTFSKTLGDTSTAIRDQRDLALSKSLLGIDRPELFQFNLSYAVPIGRDRSFFRNMPRWLDEVVGGWQVASAFQWQSGAPLTFTATGVNTFSNLATNTANLLGALPAGFSQVTKGAGFVSILPDPHLTGGADAQFRGRPDTARPVYTIWR